MSARAEALATRFEEANAEAIALVERLSDANWQQVTREGWTVAACAHHAAIVHEEIARFARRFATGESAPPRATGMGAIDDSNARHAEAFAACSKAEALAAFRAKGAAAAAILRSFSDEQLDQRAPAPTGAVLSTQQFIDTALFGHLHEHVESIRQATAHP